MRMQQAFARGATLLLDSAVEEFCKARTQDNWNRVISHLTYLNKRVHQLGDAAGVSADDMVTFKMAADIEGHADSVGEAERAYLTAAMLQLRV